MQKELTTIETLNPVVVYSGGLDETLDKIAKEAKSITTDISTEEGRKEIKSLAFKIARSKTLLDDMGEKLGEEARLKVNAINADRKKVRDFLDNLKSEVRKPLTDWEEADEARIAAHEFLISKISQTSSIIKDQWQTIDIGYMRDEFHVLPLDRDWQEFSLRGKDAVSTASKAIEDSIHRREKHDAEQAELSKLRVEAAERERLETIRLQSEREEKLKSEAAEKARKEAEDKAAHAAKAAAEAAEKILSEKQAALERAEREKVAAIETERAKVATIAKAEADDRVAREANTKHKAKINNEAMEAVHSALGGYPDNETAAKAIVVAIASGKIPHVTIGY